MWQRSHDLVFGAFCFGCDGLEVVLVLLFCVELEQRTRKVSCYMPPAPFETGSSQSRQHVTVACFSAGVS